jgi:hypothetical protein
MIDRPEYDEHGLRMATCQRCGMSWCEGRESVELLPGHWSESGERDHRCPEPLLYEVARDMVAYAQATGGIILSQRQKAAICLGLKNPPAAPEQ